MWRGYSYRVTRYTGEPIHDQVMAIIPASGFKTETAALKSAKIDVKAYNLNDARIVIEDEDGVIVSIHTQGPKGYHVTRGRRF